LGGWSRNRCRCDSGATRSRTSKALTRSTEGLVNLRLRLIGFIVLDKLNVDSLIRLDTHEMERGTTAANHLEISGVLSVVESSEGSIFDTEAVLPQV
jgi:hypothetical protein